MRIELHGRTQLSYLYGKGYEQNGWSNQLSQSKLCVSNNAPKKIALNFDVTISQMVQILRNACNSS